MEYNFSVKHIKGSSNCTADSLSRLPVCALDRTAPYPEGQLKRLDQLPISANSVSFEYEIMEEVQMLALQPQSEYVDITISQIVGENRTEAWDILPLTVADVAKATREDKVYSKL